jgi:phosphatidylglycerophosphatase A
MNASWSRNLSSPQPAQKKSRLALWLAAAGGAGFIPLGPGTWGSFVGIVISMILAVLENGPLLASLHGTPGAHENFWTIGFAPTLLDRLVVLAVASIGVIAAGRVARDFRHKDPQFVVIDEVSGQLLALSFPGIVLNWKSWLLGFILFRVFDIWKPFPATQAESFRDGWGIMADDWVAGIYAGALLLLAHKFRIC